MEKVRVSLCDEEYSCLLDFCRADLRGPSEEVRYLVREEARRRAGRALTRDAAHHERDEVGDAS